MEKAAIGVIGLGVMGHNLALNMERNGFAVAGYDLDAAKTKGFLEGKAKGKRIVGVRFARGVDGGAGKAAPHPDDGAGRGAGGQRHCAPQAAPGSRATSSSTAATPSSWTPNGAAPSWPKKASTSWAWASRAAKKARCGGRPLCPAGRRRPGKPLQPILRAIAAKAEDGEPCVAYMGPRGAGHYVKMVHNGIEYGDMQLIAEVYDLLHRGLGLSAAELHEIFAEWNQGELKSYLIEITADIFAQKDDPDRAAAGGHDPGRGAAEGHRQVDQPERAGHRRADPDHQRGGRKPHHLGAEEPSACRPPRCCAGRKSASTATARS